jgi:hypothetical protein
MYCIVFVFKLLRVKVRVRVRVRVMLYGINMRFNLELWNVSHYEM